MSRHLAIVPAFNEAGSIAQTVGEIREHAGSFDVLVIDDGSTDATGALAAAAGARVVSLPFNVGIGGAMQCGYLYGARQRLHRCGPVSTATASTTRVTSPACSPHWKRTRTSKW